MQSRKDKGSHHNQKTEIFGKKSQLGLIIQTEFQTFLKIADPLPIGSNSDISEFENIFMVASRHIKWHIYQKRLNFIQKGQNESRFL